MLKIFSPNRAAPETTSPETTIDPSALIAEIRRIEIRTSRLVNDALAGQYHSAFKGRGMEFEEVRPYFEGDDVRTIDWNVSARTGAPHVKLFREERELTVVLAVDLSGSLSVGTRVQPKRLLAARLGAALAFSAIKNNDRVGLVCFSDRTELFVPPRKGKAHVLRVIRELLAHRPVSTGTDVTSAVDHLRRVLHRRTVIFLVSDLLGPLDLRTLRLLGRRHDLVVVRLRDPSELELPAAGLVELEDAETGERVLVDSGSHRVRRAYEHQAASRDRQQARDLRSSGIDLIDLRTDQSFVEPLIELFRRRETAR